MLRRYETGPPLWELLEGPSHLILSLTFGQSLSEAENLALNTAIESNEWHSIKM